MPSAFVSYSHADEEFVLALVEELTRRGLEIRFDQVVMRVGDSLLQRLSSEIAAGDFLFAVISPDSIQSEWCRIELEQAMNEGIEEKQVKLLPVRYRQAPMPPYLRG